MKKDEIDAVAKAAKEIVKAVPIYKDTVQPVAKEVGKSLKTVGGVINVALAPLSAMVYGYESIKKNLKDRLEKKLSKTSPENIVTPPLGIVGPLLEKYKYVYNNVDLSQMFINLLANAMDKEQIQKAHPSFVNIVSELSPDEARLIKRISKQNTFPKLDIRIKNKETKNHTYHYAYINFTLLGEQSGLSNPEFTPSYLNNLQRLSIISISFGTFSEIIAEKNAYKSLEEHTLVKEIKNKIKENEEIEIVRGIIRVTDFGEMFMEAVLK